MENRPCREAPDICSKRLDRPGSRKEFSQPLFVATGQCTRKNACRIIPIAEPPVAAIKNKQNKPLKYMDWNTREPHSKRDRSGMKTVSSGRLAFSRLMLSTVHLAKLKTRHCDRKCAHHFYFLRSFSFTTETRGWPIRI